MDDYFPSMSGRRASEALLAQDKKIHLAQMTQLEEGVSYAATYVNKQYLVNMHMHKPVETEPFDYRHMRMFRIDKLVYDAEEEMTDKLVSLYGALTSILSTVILVLKSTQEGIELYLGTRCEQASNAGGVLKTGILGNFTGSQCSSNSLRAEEIAALFSSVGTEKKPCVASVALIPSLRDEEKTHSVQGIEKLMDGLAGKEFTAVLIAEPLPQQDIETQKRGLEELYATFSPESEITLSYGVNASYAVADGTTESFSNSINNSVTNTVGDSVSHTTTHGSSSSSSSSYSYDGFGSGSGSSSSYSSSYSSSQNWSRAVSEGQTKTTSSGISQTITETIGENRTFTVKHTNKSITELMENIDAQLKRIHACEAFGLWSSAAYFLSEDPHVALLAASTFRSLVAGDESFRDKAILNMWNKDADNTRQIVNYVTHGIHPRIQLPRQNQFDAQIVRPAVLVSGKELPLFMSFPRKSLPGVLVDYMASFGRHVFNPEENTDHDFIRLGAVQHKGIVNPHLPVRLDVETLCSHCFVTGSTGSGKSNTTYHILSKLLEKEKHFLVVEPAKGEYKYAFGKLKNINIFWTNPNTFRMLRLNPFSFPAGIHVLEHLDRLIEILNVCWPLYSAMPAILKSAMERAYASCGWDLVNSIHIDIGKGEFPTFSDLQKHLTAVIEESSYSADAKGDYTGALVTRVSSLTNGINGSIFCASSEISNAVLFDQNTIVDLSRVGSSETKALIMGVLVMKLNEYRMSEGAGMNKGMRHVTVLEEAHNLLKNVQNGESDLAKKSVEMISASIAEMRSYGESFLIVDQSPTAVDISAIKNTNTKIVMRLPERNDFEAVGNSFGLSEEQIREIVRLPRGTAIVSQTGWLEPVMTRIDRATDEYTMKLEEAIIQRGTICKFIHAVMAQCSSYEQLTAEGVPFARIFSRKAIEKELNDEGCPISKKDALMNIYDRFASEYKHNGKMTTVMKATFLVQSVGCAGLAEIYPAAAVPNLKKGAAEFSQAKAKAKEAHNEWVLTISNALKQYERFDTDEERIEVALNLFIYMAICVEKPRFKAMRNFLLRSE